MSDDIVVTVDMVKAMGVCGMGLRQVIRNPDLTVAENIKLAEAEGRYEDIQWWKNMANTEEFVRYRGKEITMGAYHVFNQFTGQYVECETEEDMKRTMTEIAQKILESHSIDVSRSISNELGDTTWIPHKVDELPYVVVQKT